MGKQGYNSKERERYWQNFWEKRGVFEFDPNSKKPLLTIDTPPPTVSGSLHLGHIYSYTQADVIVRFLRMAGFNVRYPFGFDDNGLPTERLVEKERGVLGKNTDLAEFRKMCSETAQKYREVFKDLWRSIGLSVDWRLAYSTISPEIQKLSQSVFRKLFEKGEIYQKDAPALYCTQCQTSIAQAEVEYQEKESIFYHIAFGTKDGLDLIIATTRPELLPACVAVFVHPADPRYKNLIGQEVQTPLGIRVPVKMDEQVSREKGTGAVMCCTYGDETDVYWVKTHDLPEKVILDREGKFRKVGLSPPMEGLSIEKGRELMVERLKKAQVIRGEEAIVHEVGVHERCGTPIEIIHTPQWFVKILDKKAKLLRMGQRIDWYPASMEKRYKQWVRGLKWDWSISRERFFGIPIPVYICQKCDEIIIPKEDKFPLDPRVKKYGGGCPRCQSGHVIGENKVLDTWFTSALTPDINNLSSLNGKLRGRMYPMSMRPQAHDIIRTWAFYTIVMGILGHNDIPWRDLMISGHILIKKGFKISKKTGGGEYSPEELIATHSADVIRYAMCSASLGQDSYFDEGELRMGKKLVTKIYNAGKFSLSHLVDFKPNGEVDENKLEATDRWILHRVRMTALKMEKEFKKYEFSRAKQAFEDFFWNDFCDNYLEIVKDRLYGKEGPQRQSAQLVLYQTFLAILKMATPFIPHITEEMYHARLRNGNLLGDGVGLFSQNEGSKSIHLSRWPKLPEMIMDQKIEQGASFMLTIISEVRKYKSTKRMGLSETIPTIAIQCSSWKKSALDPFIADTVSVTRAGRITFTDAGTKEASEAELLITL